MKKLWNIVRKCRKLSENSFNCEFSPQKWLNVQKMHGGRTDLDYLVVKCTNQLKLFNT